MTFGALNPEKISYENFTDLSTSPVRCSQPLYLGKSKKKSLSTFLDTVYEVGTLSLNDCGYIWRSERAGSLRKHWSLIHKSYALTYYSQQKNYTLSRKTPTFNFLNNSVKTNRF